MVVIGMSDIHGKLSAIERMASVLGRADLVLLAGDITHFGREDAARQIIAGVRRYAPAVLAVSGNCDHAGVERVLFEEGVACHGDCVLSGGVGFVGLSGSLRTPFHTPGEYTEESLAAALAKAGKTLDPTRPLVLVSHQPPLDTSCDRLADGSHVGSAAVRRFIEQHQPLLCLTGHIHEAGGIDRIGRTQVVNPGPAWSGGYMRAEIADCEAAVVLDHVR